MINISRCAEFAAMSESIQQNGVALVWADDHILMGEIPSATLAGIEFEQTQEKLGQAQAVLLWVARYIEPEDLVQRVCDHPAQKIH
jgi:hypothetical protein